jgi:hypothetical protein
MSSDKSFDVTVELVQRIITLSTLVLGGSVTFLKDIVGLAGLRPGTKTTALRWAWLSLLASIFLGLLTLGAVIGLVDNPPPGGVYQSSIQLYAGGQWLFFFLGMTGILVFGWKAFGDRLREEPPPRAAGSGTEGRARPPTTGD